MKYKVGDFVTYYRINKKSGSTYLITKVIPEKDLYDLKTNKYEYNNMWINDKIFKPSTEMQIANFIAEKLKA